MFVDVARISVKGGNGGNGVVSFERHKYVAAGGPNGGDGGRGGDVIFTANRNLSTLMDLKYLKKYCAQNGKDGGPSKMTGKKGEDLIIKVPMGTLIKNLNDGAVVADLENENSSFVVAVGGRGGWGNAHFATATRQTPNFAKRGVRGEEREVILELKLIADVGLLGFPNVGKSTFLSVVSAANPKIADYHFTTLFPNLGMVKTRSGEFLVADIPGMIEGSHKGAGLGHDFLRHIERTRLILHIVDVAALERSDPLNDFYSINRELQLYSEELSHKPQIVLANKSDVPTFNDNFTTFKYELENKGYKVFAISTATHQGISDVLNYVYRILPTIPKPSFNVPQQIIKERQFDTAIKIEVDNGVYVIKGQRVARMMENVNLNDYESLQYFHRTMQKMGLDKLLKKAGIKPGDTVCICGIEFFYTE